MKDFSFMGEKYQEFYSIVSDTDFVVDMFVKIIPSLSPIDRLNLLNMLFIKFVQPIGRSIVDNGSK